MAGNNKHILVEKLPDIGIAVATLFTHEQEQLVSVSSPCCDKCAIEECLDRAAVEGLVEHGEQIDLRYLNHE